MAQDVFSKMAEDQWVLNEDGYLNVDTDVKEIIYHPSLNVILIIAPSGVVRVLDVNSGVILQTSSLSGSSKNDSEQWIVVKLYIELTFSAKSSRCKV